VGVVVVAGAAVTAAYYARASARASTDAAAAAQRSARISEVSRRASERARLRFRVERVGELVQDIFMAALNDPGVDHLSPLTQGQCQVLDRAVIGLKDVLPKSVEVSLATSPGELTERADSARLEIDRVLGGLTRKRPGYRRRGTFRTRHVSRPVPWHR
jgi:hypothetical protein